MRPRIAVLGLLVSWLGCATASPLPDPGAVTLRATDVRRIERDGARIEVGRIGAAPYRIDVPERWNGSVMLYCHGYAGPPRPFDSDAPSPVARAFLADGYAVAQSAFSAGGYAVAEAVQDTEALRQVFALHFGAPRETWLSGQSIGGMVNMMLLEQAPSTYAGALPMCAALGPAVVYIKQVVFDPLVLFAYWLPGVLPSPAAVPADYTMTIERVTQVSRALDAQPQAAEALRRYSTTRSNEELARLLDLYTYIMGELEQRYGGNPIDNRDTLYSGFADDNAVNAGVQRHAADPAAERAIVRNYSPSGAIEQPMLSLRMVDDPILSTYSSDTYAALARIAGRGHLFAQKFVPGPGHCDFTPAQMRAAFAELRAWKAAGVKPSAGAVRLPP